jgi:hypothetical protein
LEADLSQSGLVLTVQIMLEASAEQGLTVVGMNDDV